MKQRKICAGLGNEKNCPYATVKRIKTIRTRIDCRNVYCTHPEAKRKYIGPVEPYFPCLAPADCPEIRKQRKSQQSLTREEKKDASTPKLPIKNGKMTIAIIGQGRRSFGDVIKEFFAK